MAGWTIVASTVLGGFLQWIASIPIRVIEYICQYLKAFLYAKVEFD
jgi:hypothetical protein